MACWSSTESTSGRVGSTLTHTPITKSSPHSARILASVRDEKRMRFSNAPPQASSRRLLNGDQNCSNSALYAAMISQPSKPASFARRAACAKPSTSSSISGRVIAWLPSWSCIEGRPEGDQFGW